MSSLVNESEEAASSNPSRQQFGNRFLNDPGKIFEHNAWDDVAWDEEREKSAREKINKNSESTMDTEEQAKFEIDANQFWDQFYSTHQDKFFKDRHWLFTEFPELLKNEENAKILEIGCGVGNSVVPILEGNLTTTVYCCDFSPKAVELLRHHPLVLENPMRCFPFVCDVSKPIWDVPFEEKTLDAVLLVFVLSAIHPDKMKTVLMQIHRYLKPGGVVYFRDYGLYDMAQLRFKPGKCLGKNFYLRGDGTRVYFFEKEQVDNLFESLGFMKNYSLVDRRLQVNRGKQLTMYRIWVQGKYTCNG